jgi:hypothetical protein
MTRQRRYTARGDPPLIITNKKRGTRAPYSRKVFPHAPLQTLSAADYEIADPTALVRLYISVRSSGKWAYSISPFCRLVSSLCEKNRKSLRRSLDGKKPSCSLSTRFSPYREEQKIPSLSLGRQKALAFSHCKGFLP